MTVTFEPGFRATAQGAIKEVTPTINTEGHLMSDPTSEQIEKAAQSWCGQKDRETFPEDMAYFRQNWSALPGLQKHVDRVMELEALVDRAKDLTSRIDAELAE